MISDDILTKPVPTIPKEAIEALNRSRSLGKKQQQQQQQQQQKTPNTTGGRLLPRIASSSNNNDSNNYSNYSGNMNMAMQRRPSSSSRSHGGGGGGSPPRPPSSPSPSSSFRIQNTASNHQNSTSNNNLRGLMTSNNNNNNKRRGSSVASGQHSDLAFATNHSDQFLQEQHQKNRAHNSFRTIMTSTPKNNDRHGGGNNNNQVEDAQQSIAEETRQFARKQLSEFRAAEEHRTAAYRQLRNGLRNIETIIQDIPISEQLAKDVKEKPPSEQTIHLQIVNTAMHRKITELTELLEHSVKSEENMRKRLAFAESRVASAENKVIDLQAKVFEAELKNLQGDQGKDGIILGRKSVRQKTPG